MNEITIEEQLALAPASTDTEEEASFRASVKLDLAKIAATGSVPHLIVGGYGITTIPRDFWERWLKANERSDVVREKIVFAMPDEGRAQGFALEHAEIRSGMEPIDPDNPGRLDPSLRKIQRGTMTAS